MPQSDQELTDLEKHAIFEEWEAWHEVASRSLRRAKEFADEFGLPFDHGLPTVVVIGSKGKGTATLYCSATLASQGYRVGTITSPGITNNRDRIRLSGRAIQEDDYRELLERIAVARHKLPQPDTAGYLSPAGIFCLAGLAYLIESGCDALVVEAGMGGISDEVSLLPNSVVIVTTIFEEHLEELGPTLLDVVRNKVGVVSADTRAVVSALQQGSVKLEMEKVLAATPISFVSGPQDAPSAVALPPGFGAMNAAAGIRAAEYLCRTYGQGDLEATKLADTIRTMSYPGRLSMHRLPCGGSILVDTAVSREGLVATLTYARRVFGDLPTTRLVSLPTSKDVSGFRAELIGIGGGTFVSLESHHLRYDMNRSDWPWEWLNEDELADVLASTKGDAVAIGTVSFITAVLNILGVSTETVFTPPEQSGVLSYDS